MKKAEIILEKTICICVCSILLLASGCGSPGREVQKNSRQGTAPETGREKPAGTLRQDTAQDESPALRDEPPVLQDQLKLPGHIKKQLSDKIQVDAQVQNRLEGCSQLYEYEAAYRILDGKQLQDIFFPQEEATKEEDSENNSYRCETVDGSQYAYSNEMTVSYHRKADQGYGKVLSFCTDSRRMYPDSFDTLDLPEQLSFMDGEEAKRIVRETAEKMEITLAPEPYVFAPLDEKALKKLYRGTYKQLAAEVSAEWADEVVHKYLAGVEFDGDKGCYYMLWQQQCPHGGLILSNNYVDNGRVTHSLGSFVMGIVNERGLASFYVIYYYEFQGESPVTEQLIGVEEALQKVAELYQTLPLTEEICIRKITLSYVVETDGRASGACKLVPAWCVETAGDNYRQYVVNAVNGDIL